jgi:hypothetical protein
MAHAERVRGCCDVWVLVVFCAVRIDYMTVCEDVLTGEAHYGLSTTVRYDQAYRSTLMASGASIACGVVRVSISSCLVWY